jgi:hypothetical protein
MRPLILKTGSTAVQEASSDMSEGLYLQELRRRGTPSTLDRSEQSVVNLPLHKMLPCSWSAFLHSRQVPASLIALEAESSPRLFQPESSNENVSLFIQTRCPGALFGVHPDSHNVIGCLRSDCWIMHVSDHRQVGLQCANTMFANNVIS